MVRIQREINYLPHFINDDVDSVMVLIDFPGLYTFDLRGCIDKGIVIVAVKASWNQEEG